MQEKKVYITEGHVFNDMQAAKDSWLISTSNTGKPIEFYEPYASTIVEVIQGGKAIGRISEQPIRMQAEHL